MEPIRTWEEVAPMLAAMSRSAAPRSAKAKASPKAKMSPGVVEDVVENVVEARDAWHEVMETRSAARALRSSVIRALA